MSVERMILIGSWIVTIMAIIVFVPRKKREAQLAFLFKQFITWSGAMFVVDKGWILFPVRELFLYGSSFTYDFFVHKELIRHKNKQYLFGEVRV